MFGGVGIFLRRLFSLGIPLWFVLAMVLGSLFATRVITRNQVIREVGGTEDFNEAMRYIEIKDIIDEKFIEPVDRKSMGYSAAIAMVSALTLVASISSGSVMPTMLSVNFPFIFERIRVRTSSVEKSATFWPSTAVISMPITTPERAAGESG